MASSLILVLEQTVFLCEQRIDCTIVTGYPLIKKM